jgi:ATP phosphoribosyltransferase
LICGRRALRQDAAKVAVVKTVLELIEARRRARGFAQVIANVPGTSVADVGQRIVAVPELAGMQGPTIAPVFAKTQLSGAAGSSSWFSVSMVVHSDRTLHAVEHLRSLGSTGIVVSQLHYVFGDRSDSYSRLLEQLESGAA